MKQVRGMTDEEFKNFVGFTREQAISIMKAHQFSPIPDRPMMPDAKMSGHTKEDGEYMSNTEYRLLHNFLSKIEEEKSPIEETKSYKSSATSNFVSGVIEK